ncbi:hypothetical protein [Nocardia testacea]|nr:hypothetical protein [Nocardia testacea]
MGFEDIQVRGEAVQVGEVSVSVRGAGEQNFDLTPRGDVARI